MKKIKSKILILLATVFAFAAIFMLTPVSKLLETNKAAAPAVVEVASFVFTDGTSPFDATTFVAPSTSTGTDSSANNGVVRNGDAIRYKVDINLNGISDDNVKFVFTVDANQQIPAMPSACLKDSSLVNPVSSISADGRTLTCNLGWIEEGTTLQTFFNAWVLGTTPNNTPVTANVTASSETSASDTAPMLTTLATSAPKLDLRKANQGVAIPRITVDPSGATSASGRLLLYSIALVGEKGGSAMTTTTYNIHDTFIGDNGSGLPSVFDNSWQIVDCGINGEPGGETISGLPFGKLAYGNSTNAVRDSGTITCTNKTSTGFDITFTGVDSSMSTTPTYTSGSTLMSAGQSYIAVGYVKIWVPNTIIDPSNTFVRNYVQYTSTPMGIGAIPNYGSMDPLAEPGGTSAPSGTGNNFVSVTMANPQGTHCTGVTADGTLGNPCGLKSNNNQIISGAVYGDYNNSYSMVGIIDVPVSPYSPNPEITGPTYAINCLKFDPATTEFVDFSREGRKTNGVNHDSFLGYPSNGIVAFRPQLGYVEPNAPYINVFTYKGNDTWAPNNVYKYRQDLYDSNYITAPSSLTHLVPPTVGSNGLGISWPDIEYSTSINDGLSASMSPAGTTQYYKDYYDETCGDADGPWTTLDPSNMPSNAVLSTITKIRFKYEVRKDSVQMDAVNLFSAYVKIKTKPSVVIGQQIPLSSQYGRTADPNYSSSIYWLPPSVPSPTFDPTNTVTFFADQGRAARLTVVGGQVSVRKGFISDRMTTLKSTVPGTVERFWVQPILVADPSVGSTSVTVTDYFPSSLLYLGNETYTGLQTGQSISVPTLSYNTPSAGMTTVEWTITGITPGQNLPEIQFDTMLAASAKPSSFTNNVNVTSPVDAPPSSGSLTGYNANHYANATLTYAAPSSFHIEKYVDTPVINTNEDMTFDLTYSNFSPAILGACQPGADSTLETLATNSVCASTDDANPIKIIDIFPWNGDALVPATTYGGRLLFKNITQSALGSETFYFTEVSPDLLISDPNDVSNAIPGTTWCGPVLAPFDAAAFSAGGCTFLPSDATGILIKTDNQMTVGSTTRHLKLTLTSSNATITSEYTNELSSRVPEISLPVISNDVTVTVIGYNLTNIVWNDIDGDGTIDTSEPMLPNTLVCITGTGSLGDYGTNVSPDFLNPGPDEIFGTTDDIELCTITDSNGQ